MPTGLGDEVLWFSPSLDSSPYSNDLSVNGFDLSFINGATTVVDTLNGGTRAYSLDGTNDYLQVSGSTLQGTAPFDTVSTQMSMSTWAYLSTFDGAPSGGGSLTGKYSGASTTFSLNHRSDDVGVLQGSAYSQNDTDASYSQDSIESAAGTVDPSTGVWYHYLLTYDTSKSGATSRLKFYLNGSLVSVATIISTGTGDRIRSKSGVNLLIGGISTSYIWGGRIDDYRIFSRVLTDAEISHLSSSRATLGGAGGTYTHRTLLGVG